MADIKAWPIICMFALGMFGTETSNKNLFFLKLLALL